MCISKVVFRKRISNANELEGLFILEEEALKIPKALHYESSFCNEIMLWSSTLGHPSFAYLQKLFPSLFLNKSGVAYQCEVCDFSEHHRAK